MCSVVHTHTVSIKFFLQFSIYETLFYPKCIVFFPYIMKSGVFDDFAGIKVSETKPMYFFENA